MLSMPFLHLAEHAMPCSNIKIRSFNGTLFQRNHHVIYLLVHILFLTLPHTNRYPHAFSISLMPFFLLPFPSLYSILLSPSRSLSILLSITQSLRPLIPHAWCIFPLSHSTCPTWTQSALYTRGYRLPATAVFVHLYKLPRSSSTAAIGTEVMAINIKLSAIVLTFGLGMSPIDTLFQPEAVFSILKSFLHCNTDGLAMASEPSMGTSQPRTRYRGNRTWHNYGLGLRISLPAWGNSHPNSILSWASSKALFGILSRVATLTSHACSVVQFLIYGGEH